MVLFLAYWAPLSGINVPSVAKTKFSRQSSQGKEDKNARLLSQEQDFKVNFDCLYAIIPTITYVFWSTTINQLLENQRQQYRNSIKFFIEK